MKYIITKQQLDKMYDSYLNYLFKGLYEVNSEEYPDDIFWKKGDEIVMELEKPRNLWILGSIWRNFSDMFELNEDETKEILKKWLEENLGLEGIKLNWVTMISAPLLK